jgi:hypothetical protein
LETLRKPGRTELMARAVGAYLILMAVAFVVRQDTLPAVLSAFMQDKPLVFATGAFTVMVSIVLLCVHHDWKSLSAIAISLIGVGATIKGAWLMIAPGIGADFATTVLVTTPVLLAAAIGAFLLGLWLSVTGWRLSSKA